jgi:hypothetical protein
MMANRLRMMAGIISITHESQRMIAAWRRRENAGLIIARGAQAE